MKPKSFTLLELLIVTLLLAIIAGGAIVAVRGSSQQAQDDMVRHRANIISKALIQFKKDMGHYPKAANILDLANVVNPVPVNYYQYLQDINEDGGESQANLEEAWLRDPENFNQLFERPIRIGLEPDKWQWNIDARRGWNGPYLNFGDQSVESENIAETYSSRYDGPDPEDIVISRDRIPILDGSEQYFRLDYNADGTGRYQLIFKLNKYAENEEIINLP